MTETVLLAAYGTLLPGCGGAEHLGISDRLRPVRVDLLIGRLWLRKDNNEDSLLVPGYVPGETGDCYTFIHETDRETIKIIDEWEGYKTNNPDSDYVREEVKTKSGLKVTTYVCNQPEKRTTFLRDGDWRRFAAHPKAKVLFHSDYPLSFEDN